MNESRYIDVAETAKLIREQFKKRFPGTRFSVRSERYSGGASIHISYTDGPAQKTVDAVAGQFEGARFDGMIDLQYGVSHYLKTDGTAEVSHDPGATMGSPYHNDEKPVGAEEVNFGANFVFVERKLSEGLLNQILWLFPPPRGVKAEIKGAGTPYPYLYSEIDAQKPVEGAWQLVEEHRRQINLITFEWSAEELGMAYEVAGWRPGICDHLEFFDRRSNTCNQAKSPTNYSRRFGLQHSGQYR